MIKKKSLFDDIYKLQSTAPELDDIDPEDPHDGSKAILVDGADETEEVAPSNLRRKAAIIDDDPKYKGRKASRKDLYSDDDENGLDLSSQEDSDSGQDVQDSDDSDEVIFSDDVGDDDDGDEENESINSDKEDLDEEFQDNSMEEKEAAKVEAPKTDDREKGKAVHSQLAIWDQLIKSRISLQKMLSLCNQLPLHDSWQDFAENESFSHEANNAHSAVRKVVSALLEVQKSLSDTTSSHKTQSGDESDEEITSESEVDEDDSEQAGKPISLDALDQNGQPMEEDEEEESDNETPQKETPNSKRSKLKRKLNVEEVEEILSTQHNDFQTYRNDTLLKWDEKTRLTNVKIKSKNFAAFDLSVLKQIEQVLVNRERLIRRIHQQRSTFRVLGCPETADIDKKEDDVPIDDDEDVEVEIKQTKKQEMPLNFEIIDDNDFYHVCLRDLIEMKQNEETDPVTANKQWLEIQRLRNKQKKKVDTRASKGRKIRYNIREKLKNYMTPYDKSLWTDEQKDDLFKALFGGKDLEENSVPAKKQKSSIIIGL